jgi:hypothetical protein
LTPGEGCEAPGGSGNRFSGSPARLGNEASRRMTSSVTLCNEYGIAFTEKAAIKDSILPPFFKGDYILDIIKSL